MFVATLFALAVANQAAGASLGRLTQRNGLGEECCPCPVAGSSGVVTVTLPAVTVTAPAPAAETVYVSAGNDSPDSPHTIIVEHSPPQQGSTVYVTNGESHPDPVTITVNPASNESPPSHGTVYITVEGPEPSKGVPTDEAKTHTAMHPVGDAVETVVHHPSGDDAVETVVVHPSGDDAVETVIVHPSGADAVETVVVHPSGADAVETVVAHPSGDDAVETAVVSVNPAKPNTVTITHGQPLDDTAAPPTVTVTVAPHDKPEKASHPDAEVIKTAESGGDAEDETQTVVIGHGPDKATITVNGDEDETHTMSGPEYVTITSGPNAGTVAVVGSTDHYQTVTRTVTNGGHDSDNNGDIDIDIDIDIDVEIIIINLDTGEQTCTKKYTGQPCHGGSYVLPSPGSPCPTDSPLTSFSTVYNTILVTGTGHPARIGYNGTGLGFAHPSGSMAYRRPRGPAQIRW